MRCWAGPLSSALCSSASTFSPTCSTVCSTRGHDDRDWRLATGMAELAVVEHAAIAAAGKARCGLSRLAQLPCQSAGPGRYGHRDCLAADGLAGSGTGAGLAICPGFDATPAAAIASALVRHG